MRSIEEIEKLTETHLDLAWALLSTELSDPMTAENIAATWTQAQLRDVLAFNLSFGIFSKATDSLAGFVLLSDNGQAWEVQLILVNQVHRGLGFGAQLLCHALQELPKKRELWLEVSVENTAALSLYKRAGFKKVGRRKAYYQTPGGQTVDAALYSAYLPKTEASTKK
jgi:[ribosomal protein S18]-alanine N-acetyltransferase